MEIALMTEGTYPYGFGGVSVWCDQLIRGMPGYDFHLVCLVATQAEPAVWSLPGNVVSMVKVPLWGPPPAGPAAGSRGGLPGRLLRQLIDTLLDSSADAQCRFGHVLRELFEYSSRHGNLSAGLASDKAVRLLSDAWQARWPESANPAPTLHDAVTAMQLLDHSLRPLSFPPVRAERVVKQLHGGHRVVQRRDAGARHRARRIPARAVLAVPQEPVPVAGQGAVPGVHAAPLRGRLPRGGDDHSRQRLQPALGGTARRGTLAHPYRVQRRGPRLFSRLHQRARGSHDLVGRPH